MKPALLALAASLASAQTFPVAGTVIDSDTGSPVRRVRLVLATRPEMTMVTGEDGRFSFDAPKGKFGFFGEKLGWRQVFGGGFGSAIITGPDQDTAHLVFRWYAPGAISGTVVDDRGDAAASVLVQLIRNAVVAGHRRASTFASTRTDDRGHYRFGPVAAGTYYLVASGAPWYASPLQSAQIRFAGAPNASPSEPLPGYATAFYPNASDAHGAAPLIVKTGAEVEANFTMRTITGASIHFSCPDGRQACGGTVTLSEEGMNGVESTVRQAYVTPLQPLEGIAPGHYFIRFSQNGKSMRKAVDVGGADVTVELAPQPAPSVSGTVTFQDPGSKPRRPVYVRLINQETGNAVARAVEPDGRFAWSNLAIGKYQPQIGSVEGFFADQITIEGAAVQDGVIDVVEGESISLNIVASGESGRLKGFAINGDKPVPAVLVVLAPVQESPDFAAYLGFQTDSDGSFDFTNVRAGDYHLFALDHVEGVEYTNPVAIRPYIAGAARVHIEVHHTLEQNVTPTTQTQRTAP